MEITKQKQILTTKTKKYIWTRLIELKVDTGYDITELIFNRPPLNKIDFKNVLKDIIKLEYTLEYDEEKINAWRNLLNDLN